MLRKLLIVLIAAFGTTSVVAQISIDYTTALGSTWDIRNTGGTGGAGPFFGECTGDPGLTIQDATTADGDGDMYDNAYGVFIDGLPFVAPDGSAMSGNVFSAGPVTLSGLEVSVEYLFSGTVEVVRSIVTLTNPTGAPISVSVAVPNNFGSDAGTTVVGTSSGDTSFDLSDRWVVTWDTSSEIQTTVLYGPTAAVTPTGVTQTVFICADTQGIGSTFDLTIPAGGTQALMYFGGIGEIDGTGSTDTANALANAAQFDSFATIDASLTSDITAERAATIVNWEGEGVAQPVVPTQPVPATALWSLILLLLGIGGAAVIGFRRV